ncbi:glutaredoxin family protein [Spirochaeta africana]|uniref:Glutaredoxin-like protein n=1 Tax=Spirochaeta africana (strain ATCC 700263 / DSM 8902 / Z-7692) TaxID=889378 RepID=H9UIT9_SPIAZ|nr:glutaredoxin [Spirochaeta africana]AFG37432.1 glutaredoxin-like protein [Spirochaeta africana DSM 8902]
MKKIVLSSLLALVLFTFGCDIFGEDSESDSPSYSIIIYGRETCGFCRSTKSVLDEENLSYTFKDIDESTENQQEMWNKVYDSDWYEDGGVGLPIVYVNGTVMERPTLEEIKAEM